MQRYGKYEIQNIDKTVDFLTWKNSIDLQAANDQEKLRFLVSCKKQQWKGVSRSDIEKVESSSVMSPHIKLVLADYYLVIGKPSKALSLLEEAKPEMSSRFEFLLLKSKVHLELYQYEHAIDLINRCILLNRDDAHLYYQKGEIYMNSQDSASALKCFEKSWSMNKNIGEIPLKLASLNVARGDYLQAVTWLDQVDSVASLEANNVKVDIFRLQENHLGANQLLSEMLLSGNLDAGHELTTYFYQAFQYDSVLYYANFILDQKEEDLRAMDYKAKVYDKKGYYSSALNYYESILRIDSLNEDAWDGMRKVKGKIAYLRKIRKQKEALPSFDFVTPRTKKTLN